MLLEAVVKLAKVGGYSLSVVIPLPLVKKMGLNHGDKIAIYTEPDDANKIILVVQR